MPGRQFHHDPWVRVGSCVLWKCDDGDEHAGRIVAIKSRSVSIALDNHPGDPPTQIQHCLVRTDLAPLATIASEPSSHGLHNYTNATGVAVPANRCVALYREGRVEQLLPGDVVSVKVEGETAESYFQINSFTQDKQTKEQLAVGRWLYTKREAMEGMPGRPEASEECDNLFITDTRSVVPVESFHQRLSVKTPWLYREELDDKRVKAHFNDDTKVLTVLQPNIPAELLYYKLRCDPNMLNEFGDRFAVTIVTGLQHAFCSRLARRSHCPLGKDLPFEFCWYQLLALEPETLQHAAVEYFEGRVNRRKVWRRCITLRVRVEELEPELGKKWYILLTNMRDPARSDRIQLEGSIMLKWYPSVPFQIQVVVEGARRISAIPDSEPFWVRSTPLPAPLTEPPAGTSATSRPQSAAAAGPSSRSLRGRSAAAAQQPPGTRRSARRAAAVSRHIAGATESQSDSEDYSEDDAVPLGVLQAQRMHVATAIRRPAENDTSDSEEYSEGDEEPLGEVYARLKNQPGMRMPPPSASRPHSGRQGHGNAGGGAVVQEGRGVQPGKKRRCSAS